MKVTVETYEQGTGKLLKTTEIEVEEPQPVRNLEAEIDALKAEIEKLKRD